MDRLVDALLDYTVSQRDYARGSYDGCDLHELWAEVGAAARPQGLSASQALGAYLRR